MDHRGDADPAPAQRADGLPHRPTLRVRVVIPALNEAAGIAGTIARVHAESRPDVDLDCVVVDGGSTDGTVDAASACGARAIRSARGRAVQCNAGAADAGVDVLLFLHADTLLPVGWLSAILLAFENGACWGRFDVELDDRSALLRVVGFMMNLRSRLTGIGTGDQALFFSAKAWRQGGEFAAIPLMEDVEICRRMKRKVGAPACLRQRVVVSARRWRVHGPVRTIVLMWWIRWLYFVGVSPATLHRYYYGAKR